MIKLKRIYDEFLDSDGTRILVDRLWPRGISKEKAHIDHWMKEIAPSDELRKWFNHDPRKWNEFQQKYKAELKEKTELIDQLRQLEKDKKTITLLYGAKNREYNQAIVIANVLN